MSARRVVRVLVALAMVAVGVLHFLNPDPFVRIVPAFLPQPLMLVYVSGVFEIVLGVLVLPERTRPLARFGLIALYLAVFPANINMAVNHIQLDPAAPLPVWAMWARLPLQALFIAAAWWVGKPDKRAAAQRSSSG